MSPRAANSRKAAAPILPTPPSVAPASPRLGRSVALVLLVVTATLYATSHMDQGIDTWISLAGGRDVAAHGVRSTDPFSFNSERPADAAAARTSAVWAWLHPSGWINQNWLTHLLLFELQRTGGLDALVVWKIFNYLLVAALLVAAARLRGAGAVAAVAAACAALAVSRDYLSIRAQDASNLLVAVLVLILTLTQLRDRRWRWALIPLFGVWANAHGGFVYGLVILAVAVAGSWLTPGSGGIREAHAASRSLAAAGAAAAAATVVLSPYRLTNIAHPLVISVGADATLWRVVREWRSLFSNPLSSPVPFLLFAALTLLALVTCAADPGRRLQRRVDLTGAAIVIVAFALAVVSARFVPIACITSAPFLAVWLDDAATAMATRVVDRSSRRRVAVIALDVAIWVAAVAAAATFGVRAGETYAAPWPQSAARTSLFDRMTHDHQRPWGPCAFLAANGAAGRIWNFWDEGGFLASCQSPDAVTGKVPMEIFIDGRAQAAYPPGALRSYLDLLNGPGRSGPDGESTTPVTDMESLRTWTKTRLHELGIWVALVPAGRQNTAFARAVATLPGWQLVYIDPEHSMFADTQSEPGRALTDRVAAGTARYPDEASSTLTAGFRLLPGRAPEDQRRAVELGEKSYRAAPSSLAVFCVTRAARNPEAADEATRFCRAVAEEFTANRDRHRTESGYGVRLEAAVAAFEYLGAWSKRTNQADLLHWADSWLSYCRSEQGRIAERVLW